MSTSTTNLNLIKQDRGQQLWDTDLNANFDVVDALFSASGRLSLSKGGTGADLSLTGGPGQIVKQLVAGGPLTIAGFDAADLPGNLALEDEANNFIVGGHTITSEAVGIIPLTLIGAGGQTANLFETRNSSGNKVFTVGPAGNTTLKNHANASISLRLDSGLSTSTLASIQMADQGIIRWAIQKSAVNAWIVSETVAGISRLQFLEGNVSRYRTGSLTADHEFMDSAGTIRARVLGDTDKITVGALETTFFGPNGLTMINGVNSPLTTIIQAGFDAEQVKSIQFKTFSGANEFRLTASGSAFEMFEEVPSAAQRVVVAYGGAMSFKNPGSGDFIYSGVSGAVKFRITQTEGNAIVTGRLGFSSTFANPTTTETSFYDQASVGPTISGQDIQLRVWDGAAMLPLATFMKDSVVFETGRDATLNFKLTSGSTASQITDLIFRDGFTGTDLWRIRKSAGNAFSIIDIAASVARIEFRANDSVYKTGSATGDHTFQRGDSTNNLFTIFQGGNVTIRNFADVALSLILDSGLTTTQATDITFNDQGVTKFNIRKPNDNSLRIMEGSTARILFSALGDTIFTSGSTTTDAVFKNSAGIIRARIFGDENKISIGPNETDAFFGPAGLTMKNAAAAGLDLTLDSGIDAGVTPQVTRIRFFDDGVSEWSIQKDASNNLLINEIGIAVRQSWNSAGDTVYRTGSSTADHQFMNSAGTLRISFPGNADAIFIGVNQDAIFSRLAAGQFRIGGASVTRLDMHGDDASNLSSLIYQATITSEANPRFGIQKDGGMIWGPGGATPVDTNLYRSGANGLKTDDLFFASGVGVGSGPAGTGYVGFSEITDPTPAAANLAQLYVKDNGSSKTQLVVQFASGAVQVLATEP